MPEPIRAAWVLNRMESGGVESVVMNYGRHIDRDNIHIDLYYAEDSRQLYLAEWEALGFGLYPIPSYTHPADCYRALYTAFQSRRYDIVHAHLSTLSLLPLCAARRAGVPVRISHVHSTAHWNEGARTAIKYLLRPWNTLWATDWFACGEKAGRWMYGDKAFDAGRVVVMPNAIDTAKFAYDPDARAGLRRSFGIAEDAFIVGHIGRFVRQKNHAFLLDIFAEVVERNPDARLLLVGEGTLEASVRRRVKAMGLERSVVFAGARRDAHKLYSAMDVFCLPSLYEGMPVVAWEAQANGLSCVISARVSEEAARTENSVRLGARAAVREWAAAILAARRRARTARSAIPDAAHCAAWLVDVYRVKLAADEKR